MGQFETTVRCLIAEGPDVGGVVKGTPLVRRPVVFTVLPVWDMGGSLGDELPRFMRAVQERVDLAKIYSGIGSAVYRLRSIVCYSAQHYIALCLNDTLAKWVVYDDEYLEVGGSW